MATGQNPKRILIGLRDIAGYGGALQRGFDEIGIRSDFLNLGGAIFEYRNDRNSPWINTLNSASGRLNAFFSKNFLARALWLILLQPILSLILLPILIPRYDAFVLLSQSTFFFYLEMPLLRILGKKVIHVFLGSDSRPMYLNGYVTGGNASRFKLAMISIFSFVQKCGVNIIESMSTETINSPPQALFHRKAFINHFAIGLPTDLPSANERMHSRTSEKIRILHAPSKATPKRSDRIAAFIEELKLEGFPIEFIQIQNRPNAEVLEALSKTDLVIDEVYSDTPMSKIAAEAAATGTPTLVGGYYSENLSSTLAKDDLPPSFFCKPEELKTELRKLLQNPEKIAEKGEMARRFVSENWTPRKVAEKFLSLFRGTYPQAWRLDPTQLNDTNGCGLSDQELCRNLSLIRSVFGATGFHLGHNPQLEAQILARTARTPEK